MSSSNQQIRPMSWAQFEDEHEPGDVVVGRVTRILKSGLLVLLTSGVQGFLYMTDIAEPCPSVGDRIRATILSMDHKRKRVGLGTKQLDW